MFFKLLGFSFINKFFVVVDIEIYIYVMFRIFKNLKYYEFLLKVIIFE